ncbi:MAG TPA: BadF/BadG/BcrA/BcrD ATPase family protein [Longimicrobiales bacterium]
MNKPRYFIGIDGGGTQTNAVVTDEGGAELARLAGNAGIVNVLEPEAGAHALADLATHALANAKVTDLPAVLCCALAGAGREAERTRLEQALSSLRIAAQVHITTDFEAAMQDAFGSGPGILVIAGTGSSAWGRAQDGHCVRAGGWGHILGDEGSGYALGRVALTLAMREYDGRGENAGFMAAVLKHTAVAKEEGLVRWAAGASKADIAALSPIIFEAAQHGALSAQDAIDDAAAEIAMHVAALYDRLGPWDLPPAVALSGGLVEPGRPLREPVLREIEALTIPVAIVEERVDAARGAAALARHHASA